MKPSKLLAKIAVLSFFVLFLVGFVAYRSGAFDKWFNEKSSAVQPVEMHMMTADNNTITTVDSPPRSKTVMSGSKPVHSLEETSDYDIDTAKLGPPEKGKKWIMMSGSKSGTLIPMQIDIDTPKAKAGKMPENSKAAPQKPKADTPVYKSVIPSSKSGRLIYPKYTPRKN